MGSDGLSINIFNIIDASQHPGRDGYVEPNVEDARNRKYVKVFGPNHIIMDTGWYQPNAFLGLHEMSVRWYTDSLVEYGAVIEYWKRDQAGNQTLSHKIDLHFMNDISDEFGNKAGVAYFHENMEYKIIIKSHPSVAHDEYVAVDYMSMLPVDKQKVLSPIVHAGVDGVPAIATERDFWISIQGDGSNYKYSYTYYFPEPIVSYFYPVATAWGGGDYYVAFHNWNADSITMWGVHRGGNNWSGSLTVTGRIVVYESVISL